MTVTIRKIGGSVAVVIPRSVARDMKLVEGTELDVTASADAIVMRRQGRRPRRAMNAITARIKPASYRRRRVELLDNRAVGKEIW